MRTFANVVKRLIVVCFIILPVSLWAQSPPPSPRSSTSPSLMGQALGQAVKDLSDQETRGEGLFIQRCQLCHSLKRVAGKGPFTALPVGPMLNGLFKDAKPDKENQVRQVILKGTPKKPGFYCPGFQYGLGPKQVDDLIAYLKTL